MLHENIPIDEPSPPILYKVAPHVMARGDKRHHTSIEDIWHCLHKYFKEKMAALCDLNSRADKSSSCCRPRCADSRPRKKEGQEGNYMDNKVAFVENEPYYWSSATVHVMSFSKIQWQTSIWPGPCPSATKAPCPGLHAEVSR